VIRRRRTSEAERALFEQAFRGETAFLFPMKAPRPLGASKFGAPPSGGVDGRTAARMRRGLLEPQARLDLHGLTEAVAHHALTAFLRGARTRGLKLVLVVTGKGRPPQPDAPFDLELTMRTRGVLRTLVPRWLAEPDLAPMIVQLQEAHKRHGGAGALYIYLRKLER
jgi:DNA-nicking Smr family endonuclease